MTNKKYNWSELLEAFDSSGLNQTEFCKQRDINPKYFNQKLSKSKTRAAPPFVKAKVSPPTSVPTSIVVDVGGCRVHIPTILPPHCSIYLHRDPVDFRKAINGLAVIVSEEMTLNPYDTAIFVFCNKSRSQLKVLYLDATGFVLWQKRLEKDKFKWPTRDPLATLVLTHEQWDWLLRGFDFPRFKARQQSTYTEVA